jgi:exodeoxyribonuclease VII large subunit
MSDDSSSQLPLFETSTPPAAAPLKQAIPATSILTSATTKTRSARGASAKTPIASAAGTSKSGAASTGTAEPVKATADTPSVAPQTLGNLSVHTSSSPEIKVISVSQLNGAIRGLLEGEFPLVWLKGEISNFKPHTSGHFYFNLKDSKAQISAVMFRGFNSHLRFKPLDGMEVMVRGKVTVYEPRGNYQIFVELMEPVGQGALQLAFEQLKKKLAAEGLFDQSRKRALPLMPRKVAIVTSPTGAAIRDMLTVLSRRFKGLDITIFPASVQGVQATREIVAAIELANRIGGFDVMIVGRGGGSIEDMWSFNEEKVARAIAASQIPTVSAVGHEIDFTIADFVADVRAPTPSAAAEIIVKNAADLADRVGVHLRQLQNATAKRFSYIRSELRGFSKRLVDPQRRLQDLALRADELETRLENSMQRYLGDQRTKIERFREQLGSPLLRLKSERVHLKNLDSNLVRYVRALIAQRQSHLREHASLLDSFSPLRTVARGYSIVTRPDGELITSAEKLVVNESIHVTFAHGTATAVVASIDLDLNSQFNKKPNSKS